MTRMGNKIELWQPAAKPLRTAENLPFLCLHTVVRIWKLTNREQ